MKNRQKKPGVKLTRAQKKKLEELTRQAKADGRHPSSAQKTIPYLSMYKDGLCRVTENYYTMSLLFDDMNYDLEDEAEQLGIFVGIQRSIFSGLMPSGRHAVSPFSC